MGGLLPALRGTRRADPLRGDACALSRGESWEVVLAPVRDASGCIVRLVGSGRDITDRKKNEAEILSLVERLLRAEDDERQRIAQDCTI